MNLSIRFSNAPARTFWTSSLVVFLIAARAAHAQAPLELVQTIPLKGPAGRLDHLAHDATGNRLFVANMANASLDIVDLKAGTLVRQVPGQKGIQGIAYADDLDRIFVGVGESGVCNVFDGKDYTLIKSISLDDPDNVRYHRGTQRVYVAHADKSLTVIDASSLKTITSIRLPGSPEAFQLEKARPRLYLNAPSARKVVAIDIAKNELIGQYPLSLAEANFPMALDEASHRIFVGCRKDPKVVVMDSESGKELAGVTIPGDIDDLFYDGRRKRLYASCGAGHLAVIQQLDRDHYEPLTNIATTPGARTSLFDPESARLYVVVPRQAGKDGPEVWVYQAREGSEH